MSHLMKSHRVRPEGGGSPAHERQSPRLMVWDPPTHWVDEFTTLDALRTPCY